MTLRVVKDFRCSRETTATMSDSDPQNTHLFVAAFKGVCPSSLPASFNCSLNPLTLVATAYLSHTSHADASSPRRALLTELPVDCSLTRPRLSHTLATFRLILLKIKVHESTQNDHERCARGVRGVVSLERSATQCAQCFSKV